MFPTTSLAVIQNGHIVKSRHILTRSMLTRSLGSHSPHVVLFIILYNYVTLASSSHNINNTIGPWGFGISILFIMPIRFMLFKSIFTRLRNLAFSSFFWFYQIHHELISIHYMNTIQLLDQVLIVTRKLEEQFILQGCIF